MLTHFKAQFDNQYAKLKSASVQIRFWHCFISGLRGHKDIRIQEGQIVNVEGSILWFNWTHIIAKIEQQWWVQYKEAFPGGSILKDDFKKDEFLVTADSIVK